MSKPIATETSGLASTLVGVASAEPPSSREGRVTSWSDSPQRAKAESSLWWWNASMAALHGVQAVIVLGAALSVDRLKAFKIPMASGARKRATRADARLSTRLRVS